MQRAVLAISLLIAVGCQSKQLYPGPPRPPSEVATIERASGRGIIRFVAIDGEEVKGTGFHLLPGRHVIDVTNRVQVTVVGGQTQPVSRHFNSAQIGIESVSKRLWVSVPCRVVFEAEPGRTYFVRGDVVELERGADHRTLVPQIWVADREVPQLDIAEHVCRY